MYRYTPTNCGCLNATNAVMIKSITITGPGLSQQSACGKTEPGGLFFAATMSRKRFSELSAMICFDDRLTRPARLHRQPDKLVAFRALWEMWVHRSGMLFIASKSQHSR